ncbi:hypothetical protein IE81DRAFT_345883 [Ceraceosorus guamensis]|uniref:Homeobox domain-containing protein n=1 Tax=Ceraceosorus guamensis TaxID=1522189 RepID=A0A316W318_9BASI|nr:hypothetical protein IE81DRAFT_345883 [Ceraceosorus guamensis]PWN44180.1 hypothetical protein IE81DRAFT_345883 [Ceraceosorus guamensis]
MSSPKQASSSSRNTPGTPGRAASGWTEGETTQGLLLMLLASGNLSLSKDKKAIISKMLGRSEKSVEMWWHGKMRKLLSELEARVGKD